MNSLKLTQCRIHNHLYTAAVVPVLPDRRRFAARQFRGALADETVTAAALAAATAPFTAHANTATAVATATTIGASTGHVPRQAGGSDVHSGGSDVHTGSSDVHTGASFFASSAADGRVRQYRGGHRPLRL